MDRTRAAEILNLRRHGKRVSKSAVTEAAAALGDPAAGGRARALKLTKAERRRIAHDAARKAGEAHKRRALARKYLRELETLAALTEAAIAVAATPVARGARGGPKAAGTLGSATGGP